MDELNILENIQIENTLWKYGNICLEDIIHELTHENKNFPFILQFLGNFKLSKNDEGFDKVNVSFNKGEINVLEEKKSIIY